MQTRFWHFDNPENTCVVPYNTSIWFDINGIKIRYNWELSSVLDKHAPLKSRMVTMRPAAPWFREEIKLERRVRRRLERRWRRTRLPEDRLRFIEQNRIVNELLLSVRSQYYTKLIDDNCLNQRKLFGIVGKLLHRSPAPQYPSCSSVADLANRFIGFFGEKIITIRHELESNPMQGTYLFNEVTVATTRLHRLSCPSDCASFGIKVLWTWPCPL